MTETKYDYDLTAKLVEDAVRKEFPRDTIDVSEGYNGRVT